MIVTDIPLALVLANQKDVTFCIDFLPKFFEACEKSEGKAEFVILEKEYSSHIISEYHIFSYPSIYVFRYGKKTVEYKGNKESFYILKYIEKISGPEVTILDSARDVHDYIELQSNCVILAGEELDEGTITIFNNVASILIDQISFGIAKDIDSIEQLGLEDSPALKLYRAQDRTSIVYPLAFSITEEFLTKWIKDNLKPKYYSRDSTTFRDLGNDNRYTFLAFVDTSKKRSLDLMHKTMSAVVEVYKDNLSYVYCDVYDVGSIMLGLGFSGAVEPAYAIVKLDKGVLRNKYVFSERRRATPSSVLKWVAKFLEKNREPELRSEPEPPEDESRVKKLVGKTFAKYIPDPNKDCVVLFLVSESDKEGLREAFEDVAGEFLRQGIRSVSFFSIDLARNDTPGVDTGGVSEDSVAVFPAGGRPVIVRRTADRRELAATIAKAAATKPKFRSAHARFEEGELDL